MRQRSGVDLIVGEPHYEGSDPAPPHFLNSPFSMIAADGIVDRYDKVPLSPFPGSFPLRFSEFLRRNFSRMRTFGAAFRARSQAPFCGMAHILWMAQLRRRGAESSDLVSSCGE